jgi:predicted NUDIX family NTP pyrophosphohydrolase
MLRDQNRSVKVRGTVDAVDTEDKSANSPTFSEDWPQQSAQMRSGGAQQNDKTTIARITASQQ